MKLMTEVIKKRSGIGFKIGRKGSIILGFFVADDNIIFCKAEKYLSRLLKNTGRI